MPVVILATVVTISALYAPQPLLPVFAREFGVGRDTAALLTTIAFIPLSLAPLVYGYVLQTVSPCRMLRAGVLLLALSETAFGLVSSFPVLVLLRLIQGLLIPAMLTALMTFVSRVSSETIVQRRMAVYIGATILGGFLGRFLSGGIAGLLGWRASFLLLAAAMVLCFFLLRRLDERGAVALGRPTPGLLLAIVRQKWFLRNYAMVFCLFLAFAAVMNFLPFRFTELSGAVSEFRIGVMYTGYVMGLLSSLLSVQIGRLLGGAERAMRAGLVVFVCAVLGLLTERVPVLFGVMFVLCGAMFLVHATAAGLLNRFAGENKGIVNGLYVFFYYGGGAVGSFAPGPVYGRFGWRGFVAVLAGVAILALLLAAGGRKRVAGV